MSEISIYRIVKKKWAANAFDGEGARLYGGRWNSKGLSCIYTTSSESLALLEMLVHIQDEALSNHYSLFKLKLPENQIMVLNHLPENWREHPAPKETAEIGDQWLTGNSSLALRVPSVVVPREYNYLINPKHPDFSKLLKTAEELEFEIDSRL